MSNMSEQEKIEFKDQIVTEVTNKVDLKLETRLGETTKDILEAVSAIMDKKMQEFGFKQEEFESRVIGVLQDLIKSNGQASTLSEKVDVHEGVIKNNILPRLDFLETSAA